MVVLSMLAGKMPALHTSVLSFTCFNLNEANAEALEICFHIESTSR